MNFRNLAVVLVLACCMNTVCFVAQVYGETNLDQIKRLSKLASQAYTNNNISRGDNFLDQAIDAAGRTLRSDKPSSFGEYPHILGSYMLLVMKKVNAKVAEKRKGQAVKAGMEGLSILEGVIAQLRDDNLGLIKDVTKGYMRILDRVVLAEMSLGGERKAVELMERGMDIHGQLMGQIHQSIMIGEIVQKYNRLGKKLVKYYLGLGHKQRAVKLVENAIGVLTSNLGSDHQTVKAYEKYLENLRKK